MTMLKRKQAHTALNDMSDAVGSMVSGGGDIIADLAPDLEDIADAAIDTVAATGRIGVRLVTRSIRFVARHPREVLVTAGLVAMTLAIAGYFRSRASDAA
jgi:hypothetical protein